MNHTEENLSLQEINTLGKEIIRAFITGILAGVMLSLLFGIIMFVKNSVLATKEYYFMLLIMAGAVFITSLTVKNLQFDLNKGIKHIYKYRITQKLSYQGNDPGLGGEKMKYLLISEEKKFSVSEDEYNYAQINDFVLEHESPKSGISLKVVILKNSV